MLSEFIECFWRALLVIITLGIIAKDYPELAKDWVWKYLIPATGLYWILTPAIPKFWDALTSSKGGKNE
jgi:hypothetical protein